MNKSLQRFIVVFILFVLLACNIPQPSETTPISNTPDLGIESSTSTPASAEEEFPPTNLTDFYLEKVRKGEWTEAEGLVALLNYALEEQPVDIPASVDHVDITGIANLASKYLQDGTDEASKTEIQRLLSLLFPSEERLEAVSIPESEANLFLPNATKLASPVSMQAQEECGSFWRDPGVSLPPCFLWGAENIGGQNHRVYFPLAYRGDDSKFPYYRAALEVLREAIPVFSEYGEMPRVYMVFYPGAYTDGSMTSLIRAGVPNFPANEACPVIIFSRALLETIPEFKQVIAHELFHCFQNKNITRHQPSNFEVTAWALEASATYFSNVVYPEVDHEYRDLPGLDVMSLRTPLYKLSYKNFLFFQHMGNQWGNEKVIEMLKAMPLTGSFQDQLNALIAYPGMIDLYESYARYYLANQIMDTSGAIHPYEIIYAKVNLISGATTGELPHNPLVLYREKFIYDAPRLEYTFTTNAANNIVRIATAPVDFPVWQVPTWQVDTTCNHWEYMTYSIGITTDILGRTASYDISAIEVPEDQPCEDCLLGTWQMDASSYINYANSLFARNTNPPIAVGWDGDMFMEYTAEGKAAATYNNFIVYYKNSFPDPNGGPKIQANLQIKFLPTSAVGYSADASTITYTGGRARIEVKGEMLMPDGVTRLPYTVPAGAFSSGGSPLAENYVCKGNYLAVIPNLPPPASATPLPIFFYRFAPPSP